MAVVYVEYRTPDNLDWLWDGTALRTIAPAKPGDVLWTRAAGNDIRTKTALLFRGVVVPSCRSCGCTEEYACVGELGGCHWVEPDLCSSCV